MIVRRLRRILVQGWLPVAVLVLAWVVSSGSTNPFFPSLGRILEAVRDNWLFAHVRSDLVPSLGRFAVGYFIAIVLGIAGGVVLGRAAVLRKALEPSLEFIRAIPISAMIPVAIVLLGVNEEEKVFIVAFGAVWPILLNTIDGVRGVDTSFEDVARVYRVGRAQTLYRVILPAASPQIFAGLRIALAIALLAVVLSELFASFNGLGYFILVSQNTFRIADMWSGIAVLAMIALLVNFGFVAVEQRVLYWHRGWRASIMEAPVDVAARAGGAGRPRQHASQAAP